MRTPSLGIPLVEFGDGDESKLRYTNETGKLLKIGYDKVRSVVIRLVNPDRFLLTMTIASQTWTAVPDSQLRGSEPPTGVSTASIYGRSEKHVTGQIEPSSLH